MNGGINCTAEDATDLRTMGGDTCADDTCGIGEYRLCLNQDAIYLVG